MRYPHWVYALPGVNVVRAGRQQRYFLSPEGFTSHFGVYGTFEEARRALPPSPEFDDAALADEYVRVRTRHVFPYDYPVLFWLDRVLRGGASSIADVGGSVGVHFHAYRRLIAFPPELRWTVLDVPAIVRIGEELARSEDAPQLRFTTRLDAELLAADIWLSAGALQYLEDGHPTRLLAHATRRPEHVLLNKLPLYDGPDYVTTQNIGSGCFAPVHIFDRARFVEAFVAAGYELVDAWEVPERSFALPGHEDRSFDAFSGLYLRRAGRTLH